MDEVNLEIDGQAVTVPAGTTIINAAAIAGKDIPTICFHEHCSANGLCRICMVEVEGARVLVASCTTQVSEGMHVQTRSERVLRSRRTILELLASTVDLSDAPVIRDLMREYFADGVRFPAAKVRQPPLIDDNPMYIRDYAKCVLCWRCVQVCAADAQYTYAINFSGRGFGTQISTFFNKSMPETTCVFCGQCVSVCPTGALKAKREWLLEQGVTSHEIIHLVRTDIKKK